MRKQNIEEKVKDIFKQIAPEVDFNLIDFNKDFRSQLEIDSYDVYRILVTIENELKVKISEKNIRKLKSFNDLLNFISEQSNLHRLQLPDQ